MRLSRSSRLPRASAWLLIALLAACATRPEVPGPPASAVVTTSSASAASAAPAGAMVAAGEASPPPDATPLPASAPEDEAQSTAAPPADTSAGEQAPTQAERDYAALYGGYDPVADPTLPAPAELPVSYDPWEPFNRRMHAVNTVVDRAVAKPLARAYMAAVPRPVRLGVGNFFRNLGQPVSALNSLLQGKPGLAGQALARFALNSTLGIGGIFDPATDADLPVANEDFGQTLGVWGWERSRYVELPLFGPRTVRDIFGLVGDSPMSPIRGIEEDKVRVFLQGLQLVDVRTQLMAVDSMLEGAPDEYALLRDAWLQRRQYQIFGDRQLEDDDSLPDYLREEYNPTVPVDAIPVMPPDGG